MQTLERMVEQASSEHVQLRAERDTLADCVRSLQEMQLQPPAPLDLRTQVHHSVDRRLDDLPAQLVKASAALPAVTGARGAWAMTLQGPAM